MPSAKDIYLVHFLLPEHFNQKFYQLIPKQRLLINELLNSGVVKSYSLDMDRQNLWMFIEAESEQEVMDIVGEFPIIKEVKVQIHELAFHDLAPKKFPDLILN